MTEIIAIRPGVTYNRSAFEAMALIYERLQREHEYEFTIAHSTTEDYENSELDTITLPPKAWRPTIPHVPIFLRRFAYRNHIDPLIRSADCVLTVDPTIFYQGALVISRAQRHDTPVLYDASKTIADPDPHWYAIRSRVRTAVKNAAGIVATVPKVMERYQDLQLLDSDTATKFHIMGHPVDTERFAPPDDHRNKKTDPSRPLTVLTISRHVPEKGGYYLLEALSPLVRSGDVRIEFIGEGPMETLLAEEAQDRGIEESVDFVGTVPHSRIPEKLSNSDLFVTHSVSIGTWEEYFGVANIEAMACGVPTVVSDCGGIPYVIRENDVAEMVPQRDVNQLRETVRRLVEDPERREELGRNGRRYVEENYSVRTIADRYHEMLQGVLPG